MLRVIFEEINRHNRGLDLGIWVDLPVLDVSRIFKKARIRTDKEYFITDYESDIDGLNLNEYDSIGLVNDFAHKLGELSDYDKKVFSAILEYEGSYRYLELIDKIGQYNLHEDINNDDDLGWYWLQETGYINPDNPLYNYIDLEAYGRDIRLESEGMFTKYGWLEYIG